jgi:membrane-associated phospholipid phosphatase
VNAGPHPALMRFDLRAPGVWAPPLVMLAAFIAVLVMHQNLPLFQALNAIGPLTSDRFWANITVLGDTVVALALCLPLWQRRADLTWAIVLGALLSSVWVHALKPVVHVPRPPAVLGEQVHVIGKAYRKHAFPSGHSTTIFALAGLVALGMAPGASRRRVMRQAPEASSASPLDVRQPPCATARICAVIAVALALLAAMSRCVVGVHWPLDVLAGAFGGWISAALGLALAQRTLKIGLHPAVQCGVGLALAGCAVALVAGYDSEYPQADALQRVLGVVCLACAAVTFAARHRSAADAGMRPKDPG